MSDAKNSAEHYPVSRTAEEDLVVLGTSQGFTAMTIGRHAGIIALSILVLMVYLAMNFAFSPAYPVLTPFAEEDARFVMNYPPYRMNEAQYGLMTDDILSGNTHRMIPASGLPVGYPLVATGLVRVFGDAGMYYTNATLMWACALMVFLILLEYVSYGTALVFTAVIAFSTPNLFFAASAYPEPLAEFLLLAAILAAVRATTGSRREGLAYAFCGFAFGLELLVQPILAPSVLLFGGMAFMERSRRSLRGSGLVPLVAGFAAGWLVFAAANLMLFGRVPTDILMLFRFWPAFDAPRSFVSTDPVLGLWRFMFQEPSGMLFVMPLMVMTPVGLLAMWRGNVRSLAALSGAMIALAVFATCYHCGPLVSETVGARQFLPVVPLMILPLAFAWEEGTGEKWWIGGLTVFTLYLCGFGWWSAGGIFPGPLQDSRAEAVILARKGLLERPVFRSISDLEVKFRSAVRNGDMVGWLKTLDRVTVAEIGGMERIVFEMLARRYREDPIGLMSLIATVDPDAGVRLDLTGLDAVVSGDGVTITLGRPDPLSDP